MHQLILLLHVLSATVWTGGHLVLAFSVLPKALAARDPGVLSGFESAYERVGMPALLIQVISGAWLAYSLLPDVSSWFTFDAFPGKLITFKLLLLAMTSMTALDTRLRIIPRLSPATLPAMARRIRLVTLLSVLFVVVGVSFRGGLLA
ncbi:CopD family protein [Noviherbaspirillum galbum]|uniref:Copper resistance protein CopD n=1 Tax=Noviherbaspirillum galbum TaxID=2709383 RepID=A0A6B3SNF3_9BURK|nr:CopD family protein [Noviherbaspirillum galbum]NEX62400.1 copper resistance protein CopD [Noviherbaspirillum galbum]